MNREEVEKWMFTAINKSCEGFLSWMENETDIVKRDTKEVVNDCEITVKPNAKRLVEYIYKFLKKEGIVITKKNKHLSKEEE